MRRTFDEMETLAYITNNRPALAILDRVDEMLAESNAEVDSNYQRAVREAELDSTLLRASEAELDETKQRLSFLEQKLRKVKEILDYV